MIEELSPTYKMSYSLIIPHPIYALDWWNITGIGSDSWGQNTLPPIYNNILHGLLSTVPQAPLSEHF